MWSISFCSIFLSCTEDIHYQLKFYSKFYLVLLLSQQNKTYYKTPVTKTEALTSVFSICQSILHWTTASHRRRRSILLLLQNTHISVIFTFLYCNILSTKLYKLAKRNVKYKSHLNQKDISWTPLISLYSTYNVYKCQLSHNISPLHTSVTCLQGLAVNSLSLTNNELNDSSMILCDKLCCIYYMVLSWISWTFIINTA